MQVKPIDMLNTKFNHRVRGYDTTEVDEFMKIAASGFEQALADNAQLRERVSSLEKEVQRFREMESTLHEVLILAQQTAEEVKTNAHKEADLITRTAKEQLDSELSGARNELEEVYRTRNRFELEFRALLRSYLDICEGNGVGRRTENQSGE